MQLWLAPVGLSRPRLSGYGSRRSGYDSYACLANAVCKYQAVSSRSKDSGGQPARNVRYTSAVWLRTLRITRWHRCHRSFAHVRLIPQRSASWPPLVSIR